MSNPEIEELSVAQKASAEVLMTLMRTSFEGMQRLAELNMAAARETFSSNVATATKLASSKDMGDTARANQELARPERMMEYWRNVYDLVSAMQKDVTAVMQANYTQLSKSAADAAEQKTSSAQDGSDVIANVMKNMLEQTNKAFENMTAVASQMTNIANANIQAAATHGTLTTVGEIVSRHSDVHLRVEPQEEAAADVESAAVAEESLSNAIQWLNGLRATLRDEQEKAEKSGAEFYAKFHETLKENRFAGGTE